MPAIDGTTQKMPLTRGNYVWTAAKKDGKLRLRVGPDPLELTEDDILVLPDNTDRSRIVPANLTPQTPGGAVRAFETVGPDEYIIIHNPVDTSDEHPNGAYSSGPNEAKQPNYGRKRVVTEGHFPLWPGQYVEKHRVHTLSANEYLMVEVEGPSVDEKAPYYALTLECAQIVKAIVDTAETKAPAAPQGDAGAAGQGAANASATPGEGSGAQQQQSGASASNAAGAAAKMPAAAAPAPAGQTKLRPGQRIIIPGNKTQKYIPPSGVRVVTEDPVQPASPQYSAGIVASSDKVVRKAVVLGPTEFCVLIDEDGKPEIKGGAGRVFPGPYDTFRTDGSRSRVYDAYHLRPDRGLLLRIIADKVGKDDLQKKLPADAKLDDHKAEYHKGDEIFLGGFDAYLVPSTAFEVIDPESRKPHVGNDHSKVFVQAIGVDQESGIYTQDVKTGAVTLAKGKKSMLFDPRKERHVQRRIPARLWNLWIGENEPHKAARSTDYVTTPWAVAIRVPNNTAALVVSESSRKTVVGPANILLEYKDTLEVLKLSRGRPKDDKNPLETSYLRVTGNRISDAVELITEDNVTLVVELSYTVEFEAKDEAERAKWFDHPNYVQLLCDSLRSRLRAAARKVALGQLYGDLAEFVRGVALGAKPEGQGQHRPGILFSENNMRLVEVDVLDVQIPDAEIARSVTETQRKVVLLQLEDDKAGAELNSRRLRAEVDEKTDALNRAQLKRVQETDLLKVQYGHERSKKETELAAALKKLSDELKQAAELEAAKHASGLLAQRLDDGKKAHTAKLAEQKELDELQAASRTRLVEVEKTLAKALADADVDRLKAVQPELIAAIQALGDSQLAAQLVENLPTATGSFGFLAEVGGLAALKHLVAGSKFEKTLEKFRGASNGHAPAPAEACA